MKGAPLRTLGSANTAGGEAIIFLYCVMGLEIDALGWVRVRCGRDCIPGVGLRLFIETGHRRQGLESRGSGLYWRMVDKSVGSKIWVEDRAGFLGGAHRRALERREIWRIIERFLCEARGEVSVNFKCRNLCLEVLGNASSEALESEAVSAAIHKRGPKRGASLPFHLSNIVRYLTTVSLLVRGNLYIREEIW